MTRHLQVAAVAAAMAAFAAQPLHAQASLEYDVKAAFLLNFTRFIHWPDAAFRDTQAPLVICVFGTNPFGDALERAVAGETASGRPLAARVVTSPAEAAACHLLFVPDSAEGRANALLNQGGSYAVTVGESRRFLQRGGAVTLFLDGGRVRFSVNLAPVEQRGVRISARMLQLASQVDR